MTTHRITSLVVVAASLMGMALTLAGCSTDENPITPDKMSQMRKEEGDQRAHFNPGNTAPPSQK